MDTRTCTECHQQFPIGDFYSYTNGKPFSKCKSCIAQIRLKKREDPEYVLREKAKCREAMKRWRQKIANVEKGRKQALDYRHKKIASSEAAEFRAKQNASNKRRNLERKIQIFEGYGGARCSCCGETEVSFLSIDHINNDGCEKRKNGEHPKGTSFYRWLLNNNFPAGFQVLCMNCQFGKKNNKGICPHQLQSQ